MNKFSKVRALTAFGALVPLASFAQSAIPDASTQVAQITTGQAAYGPVMFGLALAAVGIMVGVKWIKRGRGAA